MGRPALMPALPHSLCTFAHGLRRFQAHHRHRRFGIGQLGHPRSQLNQQPLSQGGGGHAQGHGQPHAQAQSTPQRGF